MQSWGSNLQLRIPSQQVAGKVESPNDPSASPKSSILPYSKQLLLAALEMGSPGRLPLGLTPFDISGSHYNTGSPSLVSQLSHPSGKSCPSQASPTPCECPQEGPATRADTAGSSGAVLATQH